MGVKTTITEENESKQPTWYGQVERLYGGKLPKQILNWITTETKKTGRPKPFRIGGTQKRNV